MTTQLKNLDKEIIFPFNSGLIKIVKAIENKNKNDVHIMELSNQIKVGSDIDHTILIKKVGPYLLKYKDQIQKADIEFFMNTSAFLPEEAKHTKVDTYHVVQLIQDNWKSFKDTEKKVLISIIQDMYNLYIKYLIFLKS